MSSSMCQAPYIKTDYPSTSLRQHHAKPFTFMISVNARQVSKVETYLPHFTDETEASMIKTGAQGHIAHTSGS